MITTDHFWSAYARLQEILSSSTKVTPRTIALEETLTNLLVEMETFIRANNVEDIDRHITRSLNTSAWRERSHVRIRARHCDTIAPYVPAETVPIAVVEMRELRDRVTPQEWLLLLAIAAGFTYGEMSTAIDSDKSLRVKVYRARKKMRKAA